jgi:hypothetical protein
LEYPSFSMLPCTFENPGCLFSILLYYTFHNLIILRPFL